ncbi:unnamed protein product [Rotaria socialis]|uniref:Uncharacterized protein n=1 Tax=Rotaria socialis TaxID=392032 RepID=A0A817VXP5_9BILA|nr:unnamed protein product [Rotaria socialis]CAF3475484.1 unnamed protein product [Rotaria socialis]CAF3491260.1 unnamed protein product [Rotaria socialis]CAF4463987.1 unnamed protein product [Rotaria socialis]CAF4473336.1 unnamed protein product [Rotaria socialis]
MLHVKIGLEKIFLIYAFRRFNTLSKSTDVIKSNNHDMYSSVVIDGLAKTIDRSLNPVQINISGFLAFVGVCHLPLIKKYNETNTCLHKNSQLNTFCCRCSPDDWQIFLVDRSVLTLPSLSYDLLRQKFILAFIHNNEQPLLHQALLDSIRAASHRSITCHLIHPTLQILILISVKIKPFFNAITC